ncbi:hypothetical protein DPM19_18615 [Actinomadura craniellae]|uniref:PLD phosphodiesterase domain-containing protein n=1 Tax=Actinomadura craniellae TaxID=2231787 RepID=A0A365H3Q5_9ACTN|nr:AAA domain-containing protein [Actinomadura craniellae]RAY13679.1 hypothetical protein DPM19_18615 [Actinomadura craniellae]
MPESRAEPYPVAHLRRAVQAEITAIRQADMGSAEKISLHSGRLVRRSGDDREYLFSCRRWREELGAKDLLIRPDRSRDPWQPAEVSRMPDGKIRVVTAMDLGTPPSNAQLVEDETAGLEALAERLHQVGGRDPAVNLTTAGWLVGQGNPRLGRCGDPDQLIRGYRGHRLNVRQRQAIEQALGSEITFVWGPPGTGKTEVVSYIVEGCYRQDLRVLFLAPTHVAVDQALERMCDLLAGEPGFDSGLVQRAGDISVPSLAAKYGEQISPALIADRLATALDAQIVQATARLDDVRRDIAAHEKAARASGDLDNLQRQLHAIDRLIAEAAQGVRAASGHVQETRQQIDRIGVPSGLFAQRKQARLDELRHGLDQHRGDLEACRRRHDGALADRERCAADLASTQSALAPLLAQVQGRPPLDRLREDAKQLQQQLDELHGERQKIAEAVRSRCRVMGTTVSKAVQSRTLMAGVDVVVIDEAGMVNLPAAWCAAGMARKRVVVAGDFRQLPAVTHGSGSRRAAPQDKEHSRTWMDRDAFHAAGLVDPRSGVRTDPRMVALNEQYRMRPAICAVVNEVAYPDAPLLTGRADGSRLPSSPLIESPLVLIDTSSRVVGGAGRDAHTANPVHEAVIHELIRGLQYDAVLPARKRTDLPEEERATSRLAVICPYKNQKRVLGASLTYRFGESYEGLVDTVHRFQGSQRPLVVIDTVAGAGDRLGFFYEGVGLSSATCRLLNVALSRAQDHLVVVANVRFMHGALSPASEAGRMLRHLERHAQRIPVEELVPVRSAADLGDLDAEELARPAFFPADEVPRAIEWDIAHARGSIDIYCAFLHPGPVQHWLQRLKPRIDAGLRVTVHTRRHETDTREAGLCRMLQSAGCQISARDRMHEKVMIIDDAVLWHGSLNLLAHAGSTDLMMRITDPTSCERVRRIVDRARTDRPAQTGQPAPRPPSPSANGASPGDVIDGRRYLDVPFAEKDEAKRLVQAKWDPRLKLWHVAATVPRDRLRRWLPDNT